MNRRSYSKFMMYLKVQQFNATRRDVVSVLPEFAQLETTLNEGVTNIQSCEVELSRSKAGIVVEKSQMKKLLAQLTSELSVKIYAYALITNDQKLQNEVRLTDSQLYYANDLTLITRAKSTYEFCITHLENLGDFQLTESLIQQQKSVLDRFEASFMNPRIGVESTRKVIAELNNNFSTVDTALTKWDAVMEIIRYSNSAVYDEYKSARKFVTTVRSMMLKGRVLESNGTDPVKGATLSFVVVDENDTNTDPVLVKVSADKGGFQIKSIAEGDYVVTVSKKGYKDQVVSLIISSGVPADLVVRMEKA